MKKLTNSGPLFGFHPVSNRRPLARQVAEQNAVFALSPTAHSRGTGTRSGSSLFASNTSRARRAPRGFSARVSLAPASPFPVSDEVAVHSWKSASSASDTIDSRTTTCRSSRRRPRLESRRRHGFLARGPDAHAASEVPTSHPARFSTLRRGPVAVRTSGREIRLGRALPRKKDRPTPSRRRRRSAPPSPPPLGSSRA